jgi:hypothetical protein
MKTIVNNLVKVVANAAVLSLTIAFSYTANAQSVTLPGEDLSLSAFNSTPEIAVLAEDRQSETKAIEVAQPTELGATSTGLPKAVDQALSMLSLDKLTAGETKATVVIGGSSSLLNEQSVTVKVNYDARPVGGILTVRASMTPTFRGVGISARPEITRSVAMAVDEYDAELVKELTRNLTSEISEVFALN